MIILVIRIVIIRQHTYISDCDNYNGMVLVIFLLQILISVIQLDVEIPLDILMHIIQIIAVMLIFTINRALTLIVYEIVLLTFTSATVTMFQM